MDTHKPAPTLPPPAQDLLAAIDKLDKSQVKKAKFLQLFFGAASAGLAGSIAYALATHANFSMGFLIVALCFTLVMLVTFWRAGKSLQRSAKAALNPPQAVRAVTVWFSYVGDEAVEILYAPTLSTYAGQQGYWAIKRVWGVEPRLGMGRHLARLHYADGEPWPALIVADQGIIVTAHRPQWVLIIPPHVQDYIQRRNLDFTKP